MLHKWDTLNNINQRKRDDVTHDRNERDRQGGVEIVRGEMDSADAFVHDIQDEDVDEDNAQTGSAHRLPDSGDA